MKNLFRSSVFVILLFGAAIYLPSCKKDVTPPIVTTAIISDITFTSASAGGFVKDDGGAEITEKGVCWGRIFPTVNDSKTIEGAGSGSFTSVITGLMPGTLYFVRAYAINSAGIAYGSLQTFTTDIQSVGTVKADFPGGKRSGAASFSIGSKVYIGLGYSKNYPVKDFWEWDQATNIWTKKADFGGSGRIESVGFSIGNKGYIGTGYRFNVEFEEMDNLNDLWEFDPALE